MIAMSVYFMGISVRGATFLHPERQRKPYERHSIYV
jgi:hypothetical protein